MPVLGTITSPKEKGPVTTLVVEKFDDFNAAAIREGIESDELEVVVHVLPKAKPVTDDD